MEKSTNFYHQNHGNQQDQLPPEGDAIMTTPYTRSSEKMGGGGSSCCGPIACCLFICCCVLPAIAVGMAYYYANQTLENSGADNWQDYIAMNGGGGGGDGEGGGWQDMINNMDDETIAQYTDQYMNGDDDTIAG